MRKYRINVIYIIIAWCLFVAFAYVLYFLAFSNLKQTVLPSEILRQSKAQVFLIGMILVFSVKYIPEYLNRYVEIQPTQIVCANFRLLNIKKPVTYHFLYSNIIKLNYKRFLGLQIYESSLNRPVTIWFSFRKKKRLYFEIITHVIQINPTVEINATTKKLLKTVKTEDG